MDFIDFIIWIILGILAGFVAGKLFKGSGNGLIVNLILGIAGSLLGGWLYSFFTGNKLDGGISIINFLVAVGGAVVILFVFRILRGK